MPGERPQVPPGWPLHIANPGARRALEPVWSAVADTRGLPIMRAWRSPASRRGCSCASDERLVARRPRRRAAFEVLYDRHHRALLVVLPAHARLAARTARTRSSRPSCAPTGRCARQLRMRSRPWLYAIARNRCLSMLRRGASARCRSTMSSRRSTGSPTAVELRADLRELVADLGRLPEDQRAALVLFELGGLRKAEIAAAIGVPAGKVKALVFQARAELMAERDARSTPCARSARSSRRPRRRPAPRPAAPPPPPATVQRVPGRDRATSAPRSRSFCRWSRAPRSACWGAAARPRVAGCWRPVARVSP